MKPLNSFGETNKIEDIRLRIGKCMTNLQKHKDLGLFRTELESIKIGEGNETQTLSELQIEDFLRVFQSFEKQK